MTVQMKSVADVLEEAKRLIEGGWVQGTYYADAHGSPCEYEGATTFCAFGAIVKAAETLESRVLEAQCIMQKVIGGGAISGWNDATGRTKEEVLAAFSRAIAQARGNAAR